MSSRTPIRPPAFNIQSLVRQAHSHPVLTWSLSMGMPFIIVWLYLIPGTAALRKILWPVGTIAMFLALTFPDEIGWYPYLYISPAQSPVLLSILIASHLVQPPFCTLTFSTGVMLNLDAGIRFAFQKPAAALHPLPRLPALHWLREYTPFRGFDLAVDLRRVGRPPNPPLKPGRPYVPAVLSRLQAFIINITLHEACYLIVVRLAPDTFGSTGRKRGNFITWIQELGLRWDIPWPVVWVGMVWVLLVGILTSVQAQHYLAGSVCIAIGYHTDEEWPPFMNGVMFSDSLNDFWGSRYHQALRYILQLWISPFTPRISRQLHIAYDFMASFILHILFFAPMNQGLHILGWGSFFGLQAAGCLLERHLYKAYGIRTRGRKGRLWVFAMFTISSLWLAKDTIESNYLGHARRVWIEDPQLSLAEWILWGLGIGARPMAMPPPSVEVLQRHSS